MHYDRRHWEWKFGGTTLIPKCEVSTTYLITEYYIMVAKCEGWYIACAIMTKYPTKATLWRKGWCFAHSLRMWSIGQASHGGSIVRPLVTPCLLWEGNRMLVLSSHLLYHTRNSNLLRSCGELVGWGRHYLNFYNSVTNLVQTSLKTINRHWRLIPKWRPPARRQVLPTFMCVDMTHVFLDSRF